MPRHVIYSTRKRRAPAPDSLPYSDVAGTPAPPPEIRGVCNGPDRLARKEWVRSALADGHSPEVLARTLGVTRTLILHAGGRL